MISWEKIGFEFSFNESQIFDDLSTFDLRIFRFFFAVAKLTLKWGRLLCAYIWICLFFMWFFSG